ncbi:MAG: hypothetical protein WC747_00145 [Candidatus Babeliales bacterium]|jgi:hypothetical protein
MKIKTVYIFISLIGLQIEIQAPPKKFKGNRAIVSGASALYMKNEVCTPVSAALELPENTLTRQGSTSLVIQEQPEEQQEPIPMDSLEDVASQNDALQEVTALPLDAYKSSAKFASLKDVAGTPPLTILEIQARDDLKNLQTEWDIAEEEEPTENKSWSEILAKIPESAWRKYVADNYRIERLLREVAAVQTYKILSNKAKSGSLVTFISRLNHYKNGEGDTWVNEAARQAIDDDQEEELKNILIPEIKPSSALTGATRGMVLEYLGLCGKTKQEAHDQYVKRLENIIHSLDEHQPSEATKNNNANDDDDDDCQ